MDFSSIIHFLTDRTRNLSSKAIFIVFALLLLILLDNTLSFSYYYNTSQKATQTKEISEQLKDTTLSESDKNILIKLRTDILGHKTIKDISYDYLTNLNFETLEITQSKIEKTQSTRNSTIHFLTSAWWIIIPLVVFGITLPFVLLVERKDTLSTLLAFAILSSLGYLTSLILSKILSFIPLINNNPTYNYVINFILSGIILIFFVLIGKRINKK